jgi:hypothetical protein
VYCLCVNVYCHRVSTQLQLTNISININDMYSGLATGRMVRGSNFFNHDRHFCSAIRPDRFWCPLSLLFNGYYQGYFTGVKRLWRDVEHSPSSNIEVKNEWIYTASPPYMSQIVDGEKCTFYLYLFISLFFLAFSLSTV